jgi:pimeloyl-ACP methyl ester carboxylesterase
MNMSILPESGYLGLTTAWRSGAAPAWSGRRVLFRDRPTLHFLSGNGFCGGVYWPLLRRFLPDFGLLCTDIEGQGASEGTRYSGLPALLQRSRQAIAEQGLDGGALIGMGHSFGAALTLRLAAANPGMFRALVLLDPIVMPPPLWLGVHALAHLGRHPMVNAAKRRRARWPSRTAARQHLEGRGIYAGWTAEALDAFVQHALAPTGNGSEVALCCPRELEAEIYAEPLWAWRAFREVRCPVLFLRGRESYGFFPWAERLAQRANPAIRLRSLPGGHCFMQQDPAATHAAVREFLDTLRR